MEIVTPQLIWKGYDASVLPLNVSTVSKRVCEGVTVSDAYFNGSTVTDGVVRVSVRSFIPEKSGSITQMCSENFTPEDFCYGVLKGMSTELYQMYMTIQKGTGIKIRRMIGSGNGLRKNPVLCEIIEDMFKAELVLAECEEEAATGAAMSSSM